jgi:hypothetical protein
MSIPVIVQGIGRCWPGSTFGADPGANRTPNKNIGVRADLEIMVAGHFMALATFLTQPNALSRRR